MSEDRIIRSQEQHRKMIEERRKKSDLRQVREECVSNYSHAQVASQIIKVINSIKIDPFVQNVMTLRVMGPMITGKERTHISIALELGATVDDVEQAEAYGIGVINHMLERVAMPDFIEKYNRNAKVERAVKELAKE